MTWDPAVYGRFADERSRPFHELFSRVAARDDVRRAVDLGCGSGELTRLLAERWPAAQVVGVDSSAEMLAAAAAHVLPGRLSFERGDAATWRAPGPQDLVFSNAAFQWIDDHAALLAHVVAQLAPGGTLAVQMPGNGDAASHRLIEETARRGPWAARLASWRPHGIWPLERYVEALWSLGLDVDAWATTYVHVLDGDDPVLRWVEGTALRPLYALLGDGAERAAFRDALAARLREAYPPAARGTMFPFRRVFFVATRA